jgi:hypothetical protein
MRHSAHQEAALAPQIYDADSAAVNTETVALADDEYLPTITPQVAELANIPPPERSRRIPKPARQRGRRRAANSTYGPTILGGPDDPPGRTFYRVRYGMRNRS